MAKKRPRPPKNFPTNERHRFCSSVIIIIGIFIKRFFRPHMADEFRALNIRHLDIKNRRPKGSPDYKSLYASLPSRAETIV
ncbi:MAG TPA: hypothetical protein VNI60_03605 [Pyrinomonadaceae bacterium]|nr:hypothetical protein [Pyrinomonadaceae bacterium]